MTNKASVGHVIGRAVFTISLDTELGWGWRTRDVKWKPPRFICNDKERGRGAIKLLLALFDKYEIPATWAVVGHLFLDPCEADESVFKELPQFAEGWIDWNYYNSLKGNPLYHGKDIVEMILANKTEQEIGLHSFFHIPFSECSRDVAQAEVELGLRAARRREMRPRSFVMPLNQIGHRDVLKENGFLIYRGERTDLRANGTNKVAGAIGRILATPVSPLYKDGIYELPNSMCFSDLRLPFSLLPRAKLGLFRAILTKKVFNVFLHPWNLLLYKQLAEDLESFLAFVSSRRDEGELVVMSLSQLALCLNKGMERDD